MKKFFINTTMLLALLFIIDKPVGFFISKYSMAKQFDNRIDLVAGNKLSAHSIILGSSRAANGIDAKKLEEETGQTWFNLGYCGSNLGFHNTILRLLLNSGHTPKRVLLTMDHGRSFVHDDNIGYRKDALTPYAKYPLVYKEICRHGEKNYWLGRCFWMYRENSSLFSALIYLRKGVDIPDNTTNIDSHGSILNEGQNPLLEGKDIHLNVETYSKDFEKPILLDAFNEIIEICKENDIELVLVLPPVMKIRFLGYQDRFFEIINGRARVLNYTKHSFEEKHFYDYGHLNKEGAGILAKTIAKDL